LRRQGAAHVIQCQPCHTLLDEVRAVVHLCRQAGPVEPLIDLPAHILRATAAGEMMSCSVFDELILDYFDGFITASDFHVFEAHFDACPRCQRLMKGIQHARELCQTARSVEIPEGLQERIISATIGSGRSAGRQKSEEVFQRLTHALVRGLRTLARPLLTPEFVTAVILCLATVGLLLLDFSDDMSVSGIYRRARGQIAAVLPDDGSVSAGKGRVVSELQGAKRQLNNIIEMGIALFSATSEVSQPVPANSSADQAPLDNQHDESSQDPEDSQPMTAPSSP
jgi:hypothetical protein